MSPTEIAIVATGVIALAFRFWYFRCPACGSWMTFILAYRHHVVACHQCEGVSINGPKKGKA